MSEVSLYMGYLEFRCGAGAARRAGQGMYQRQEGFAVAPPHGGRGDLLWGEGG